MTKNYEKYLCHDSEESLVALAWSASQTFTAAWVLNLNHVHSAHVCRHATLAD